MTDAVHIIVKLAASLIVVGLPLIIALRGYGIVLAIRSRSYPKRLWFSWPSGTVLRSSEPVRYWAVIALASIVLGFVASVYIAILPRLLAGLGWR